MKSFALEPTERDGKAVTLRNDLHIRNSRLGVPVVAQWLANLTRNREVAGSVPALAQWVDDPLLP